MTTPVFPAPPLVARDVRRRRQLRLARYRTRISLAAWVPPLAVPPPL